MTSFKPTMEGQGAATYHFKSVPSEHLLEPFLWKLLLLTALTYFIWSERITIDFGPITIQKAEMSTESSGRQETLFGLFGLQCQHSEGRELLCDTVDNLTFLMDPSYAQRNRVDAAEVQLRMQQCQMFVARFSPVAIAEMRQFGVPASILMAQALLASNAGEQVTAIETNNYFLRQCHLSHCKLDHYVDSTDPEQVNMLDSYPNLWGSFRAQSLFLKNSEPYSALFQLSQHNFRGWARGLSEAGYSADPQYSEKLIMIIQSLQLDALDSR